MQPKILVALYLAAVVAANLIVATFGPAASVVCAFLFIGLDLSTRDRLHEVWHGNPGKLGMLIATGSLLSYALNTAAGPIALASLVAFAASGTVDTLVYQVLRDRAYLVKANGSNVVSAAVDSLIFPALAFGLPLLWPIVLGQFVAKTIGGALWAWLLAQRRERLL